MGLKDKEDSNQDLMAEQSRRCDQGLVNPEIVRELDIKIPDLRSLSRIDSARSNNSNYRGSISQRSIFGISANQNQLRTSNKLQSSSQTTFQKLRLANVMSEKLLSKEKRPNIKTSIERELENCTFHPQKFVKSKKYKNVSQFPFHFQAKSKIIAQYKKTHKSSETSDLFSASYRIDNSGFLERSPDSEFLGLSLAQEK